MNNSLDNALALILRPFIRLQGMLFCFCPNPGLIMHGDQSRTKDRREGRAPEVSGVAIESGS